MTVQTRMISSDDGASPTQSILAEDPQFAVFITYLKYGPSRANRIDYENARRIIAFDPVPAIEKINRLIEASKDDEVELRQSLFSAAAQIVDDTRLSNPGHLDDVLRVQLPTVRSELAKAAVTPNTSMTGLSAKQMDELSHIRPFTVIDGKLHSVSLPAQLAALYSIGISQTELANEELQRISNSDAYAAAVRTTAGHMLNSSLFSE